MTSAYDNAFTTLMGNEGGYVNNPADPGGETMYGITQRVAKANGYMGAMKDLPLATAKAIAKKCYWDVTRCDELDPRVAFQMFDITYNGGHAVQWLQKAVGATPDGILGNATITAANASEPLLVVMRLSAQRLLYYTSLTAWSTFGKGWATRVANNLMGVN